MGQNRWGGLHRNRHPQPCPGWEEKSLSKQCLLLLQPVHRLSIWRWEQAGRHNQLALPPASVQHRRNRGSKRLKRSDKEGRESKGKEAPTRVQLPQPRGWEKADLACKVLSPLAGLDPRQVWKKAGEARAQEPAIFHQHCHAPCRDCWGR